MDLENLEVKQFVNRFVSSSVGPLGSHHPNHVVGDNDAYWQSATVSASMKIRFSVGFPEKGVALGIAIQDTTACWGLSAGCNCANCAIRYIFAKDLTSGELVQVWEGYFTSRQARMPLTRIDFLQKDVLTDEILLEFVRRPGDTHPQYRARFQRLQLITLKWVFPLRPNPIEVFSEPAEALNVQSIVDLIDIVSDAKIEVFCVGDESKTVLRCFESLLSAGGRSGSSRSRTDSSILDTSEWDSDDDIGQIVSHRIVLDSKVNSMSLCEDTFIQVLFGSLSIDKMVQRSEDDLVARTEFLDFCEVILKVGMTRLLWYVCDRIATKTKMSLATAFRLFKTAFKRFEEEEEEIEGELEVDGTDDDVPLVSFHSVVCLASFAALKRVGSSVGRAVRRWLMKSLLYDAFLAKGELPSLRTHPDLFGISESAQCVSPCGLLAEFFRSNPGRPNARLQSHLTDGPPVLTHIELLLLSFEFFRLMLHFEGQERTHFVRRRVVKVEELSPLAIELLVQFAQTGQFPEDPYPTILDTLLILRLAERHSDETLKEYCIGIIQAVDTRSSTFIEQLMRIGDAFEDVQSRTGILESWAGQGQFTLRTLVKRVERCAESARATGEIAVLSREVTKLKRMHVREIAELKSQVDEERTARERLQRKLDSLKLQVHTLMKEKSGSD